MSAPPPPPPSLDTTFGFILIGLIVTGSTYGLTSAQAVWYFMHYPNDRKSLRYMVYVICGLDTLNLVFYFAASWGNLVRRDIQPGSGLPWTSNAQLFCNPLTIAIIQSFYVFRIRTLTKYKLLVGILCVFVLGDLTLGWLVFVKSVQSKSLEDIAKHAAFDIAMSSTTITTDVLLCSSIVVLLATSRTANVGSKRLIRKLVFYTVETGLLTTICVILSLVTGIVWPNTTLYVMFYYISSRMYSASLLAMLNARDGLRNTGEQHFTLDMTSRIPTGLHSGDKEGRKHTASAPPREILVSIQRDTTVAFGKEDQRTKDIYNKSSSRYKKPTVLAAANSEGDTSSMPEIMFGQSDAEP